MNAVLLTWKLMEVLKVHGEQLHSSSFSQAYLSKERTLPFYFILLTTWSWTGKWMPFFHYIQFRLRELIPNTNLESRSTVISSKWIVNCGQRSAGIKPPEMQWVGDSYTGFVFWMHILCWNQDFFLNAWYACSKNENHSWGTLLNRPRGRGKRCSGTPNMLGLTFLLVCFKNIRVGTLLTNTEHCC